MTTHDLIDGLTAKSRPGRRNGAARLTESAVIDMRRRYHLQQPRVTVDQLAKEYGVRYFTAWSAIHGQTWAHVDGAVREAA